ncbi:site-specific recombinase XerD [Geomicrobium halophilum]|uniref:Site-specific recombinase XerD n=1 Tax=Geomicrobium halophilum TaxID=549000 RepID=A0A841PN91_9BACL|nr:site-specific recombinase XerD [Geomicrobium halophilum]
MENALFEFFYSTCRIGENFKLNRDDINFSANSVIVQGKGDKERKFILISDVEFG